MLVYDYMYKLSYQYYPWNLNIILTMISHILTLNVKYHYALVKHNLLKMHFIKFLQKQCFYNYPHILLDYILLFV